jgi:RNA polymerase primary sigma factor
VFGNGHNGNGQDGLQRFSFRIPGGVPITLHVNDPGLSETEEHRLARIIHEADLRTWTCALRHRPFAKAILRSCQDGGRLRCDLFRHWRRPRGRRALTRLAGRLLKYDSNRKVLFRVLAISHHAPTQRAFTAAQEARTRFIRANIKLVLYLAVRYARRAPLMADDLVSEGLLGLMRAVDRYDPDRGFRFSTYASWWIRQRISRAIQNQGGLIHIPVYKHDANQRASKIANRMRLLEGREPDDDELADENSIPTRISTMYFAHTAHHDPYSQDTGPHIDSVVHEEPTAEHRLTRSHSTERIQENLSRLPPKERQVIIGRFLEDQTLAEVGDKMGLTRERVRQIEIQAMKKLRRWMSGEELSTQ